MKYFIFLQKSIWFIFFLLPLIEDSIFDLFIYKEGYQNET